MRTRNTLLAGLGLSLAHALLPAQDPVAADGRGAPLHDWLTRMAAFGMHGAVLVIEDDEVVLRGGYGIADRATGRPITARTRFDIGSLAKQFTAVAALALVDRGELGLHEPLADILGEVPADKAEITPHQLMAHLSGLPYQAAGALLDHPLAFDPGTAHAYSNVGYAVLRRVVEERAGAPLEQVLAPLFARAGVEQIAVTGRPQQWDDLAHAYLDGRDLGTPATIAIDDALRGAGGFSCTIDELHRWVRALANGELIDAGLVERMWTDHAFPDEPYRGYGCGFDVLTTMRGSRVIRHRGDFSGFSAELRYYPDENRFIVYLGNVFTRGQSMREAVVQRIALLLTDGDVPWPPESTAVAPGEAAALQGRYVTGDGVSFSVEHDGDALLLAADHADGLAFLFGGGGDDDRALAATCAERTSELITALGNDDRAAARPLVDPAWVWPGSYASLRRVLAGSAQRAAVVGTAVDDAGRGQARTVVSLGTELAELTWNRRGVIACQRLAAFPARRLRRTRDGHFAAFDVFTGDRLDVTFTAATTPGGRSTMRMQHAGRELVARSAVTPAVGSRSGAHRPGS